MKDKNARKVLRIIWNSLAESEDFDEFKLKVETRMVEEFVDLLRKEGCREDLIKQRGVTNE